MSTKPIAADFGVYAAANLRKYSAATYYRNVVPLRSLYKRGLANIYLDDGEDDRESATRIMMAADIALFWNSAHPDLAQQFRDWKPVMKDGALVVPPAFVLDMDDAVEFTHPLNNAFTVYGTKDWAGETMKPGDGLYWPEADGSERPMWIDKQTHKNGVVFDIERNLNNIAKHYEMARTARGVVCATEPLAQIYRDNGCENVLVYPNSVLEEDYFFPNLAPHDGIRIFWQGGDAHFLDWVPLIDPLTEVMKQNPKAKLVIWGQPFPWVYKNIPAEQLEIHGWEDYHAYKIKRACMDVDINLCPLIETPFNDCKSAIKWYEASLGPRPELTIAANVGPYKREIVDGETGLLYDSPEDFATKLTAGIKNAELRATVAHRGQDWVRANRAAEKTIVPYYEFMQDIKRRQRSEALAI